MGGGQILSPRQCGAPTTGIPRPGVLYCWDIHGELGFENVDKLVRKGLSFPALEQPSSLLGVILGRQSRTILV